MTDDKKNIPEAAPPTEAPAPAVENAVVPRSRRRPLNSLR